LAFLDERALLASIGIGLLVRRETIGPSFTARSVYEFALAHVDSGTGNLERVIAYKRFTGEEYQSPVADILLHLALHGAHHRGQMATYVSSKGAKPFNTDFVQFCLLHGV
jgi:hypothetical protein